MNKIEIVNRKNVHKLTGEVVSYSGNATVVVKIQRKYMHTTYKKILTKSKKVYAHLSTEFEEKMIGKKVSLIATKPISKLKRWIVVS